MLYIRVYIYIYYTKIYKKNVMLPFKIHLIRIGILNQVNITIIIDRR